LQISVYSFTQHIEEKWKQYRMVTNEEDAWLFKEWLIEQTYGGNK
jgi:hypothetical protein